MSQANLALRFLLELVAIVGVAYWGYTSATGALRWLLAIGTPLVLVALWSLVIAPGANVPIPQDVRVLLGSVVLLGAALLVYAAGQAMAAVLLAAVVIVNTLLMFALRD